VARGGERLGGHLGCHRPSLLAASGHPQGKRLPLQPVPRPRAAATVAHMFIKGASYRRGRGPRQGITALPPHGIAGSERKLRLLRDPA
jgi:hypothetical protein